MWKTYLNAFVPPILWAMVIYFLSDQSVLPGFEVSLFDFVLKKTGHVFVYAVLFFLVYRGLKLTYPAKSQLVYLPLLICLLYAISDEIHQSFTPGRYPSPRDVGYDLLGAGLAWLRQHRYL